MNADIDHTGVRISSFKASSYIPLGVDAMVERKASQGVEEKIPDTVLVLMSLTCLYTWPGVLRRYAQLGGGRACIIWQALLYRDDGSRSDATGLFDNLRDIASSTVLF